MVQTILTAVITFIITSVLSYMIAIIKTYNNKNNEEHEAVLCLLRSSITGKCVMYLEKGYVIQQEKENVNMMRDAYVKMGGNSYVIDLVNEFNKLPKR